MDRGHERACVSRRLDEENQVVVLARLAGWFGSEKTIEEVLTAHGAGEEVRKRCGVLADDGTIQVSPEDLARLQEAAEAVRQERQRKEERVR